MRRTRLLAPSAPICKGWSSRPNFGSRGSSPAAHLWGRKHARTPKSLPKHPSRQETGHTPARPSSSNRHHPFRPSSPACRTSRTPSCLARRVCARQLAPQAAPAAALRLRRRCRAHPLRPCWRCCCWPWLLHVLLHPLAGRRPRQWRGQSDAAPAGVRGRGQQEGALDISEAERECKQ